MNTTERENEKRMEVFFCFVIQEAEFSLYRTRVLLGEPFSFANSSPLHDAKSFLSNRAGKRVIGKGMSEREHRFGRVGSTRGAEESEKNLF